MQKIRDYGILSMKWVTYTITLMYGKTLSGRIQYIYLLSPNRESTKDQRMDTTNVQLGELVNVIGVTYRIRSDSKAATLPKPTLALPTTH